MTQGDQKAGTQGSEREQEKNEVKRLTKSKTAMGRMASSLPSSPQLVELLKRLPLHMLAEPSTSVKKIPEKKFNIFRSWVLHLAPLHDMPAGSG
jgi:hypothetical protein